MPDAPGPPGLSTSGRRSSPSSRTGRREGDGDRARPTGRRGRAGRRPTRTPTPCVSVVGRASRARRPRRASTPGGSAASVATSRRRRRSLRRLLGAHPGRGRARRRRRSPAPTTPAARQPHQTRRAYRPAPLASPSTSSGSPPNSTAAKSVTPISPAPATRSATSSARADDGDVGRPGGALAVEHRPVARQLPVDGEDLGRPLAGAGDVAVTHTGSAAMTRGAGRPAASAAALIVGMVWSASVSGPVHHV